MKRETSIWCIREKEMAINFSFVEILLLYSFHNSSTEQFFKEIEIKKFIYWKSCFIHFFLNPALAASIPSFVFIISTIKSGISWIFFFLPIFQTRNTRIMITHIWFSFGSAASSQNRAKLALFIITSASAYANWLSVSRHLSGDIVQHCKQVGRDETQLFRSLWESLDDNLFFRFLPADPNPFRVRWRSAGRKPFRWFRQQKLMN